MVVASGHLVAFKLTKAVLQGPCASPSFSTRKTCAEIYFVVAISPSKSTYVLANLPSIYKCSDAVFPATREGKGRGPMHGTKNRPDVQKILCPFTGPAFNVASPAAKHGWHMRSQDLNGKMTHHNVGHTTVHSLWNAIYCGPHSCFTRVKAYI